MRPTKHQQSALHCPLTYALGTEANVRVLRVLFLSPIPLGIAELARETRLQASGLPRICENLEDLGAIQTIGRNRSRQFHRKPSTLWDALLVLFQVERTRAEGTLDAVRNALQSSSARAAWLEGAVALQTDAPNDPIVVGALVEDTLIDSIRESLWAQLLEVQERRGVSIELRLMTEADIVTADAVRLAELEAAVPILGAPPLEIAQPKSIDRSSEPGFRTKRHEDSDRRLLRIATIIAGRLKRDPGPAESAKAWVERRLLSAAGSERLALREWQDLLRSNSVPRLRRILVQNDERGRRLRQSLPFLEVLTADERASLLRDTETT